MISNIKVRTWLHCLSAKRPTRGLRIGLMLCRRLLLHRPYVGEINSPRHRGMQTADALMLCRPHWMYRKHRSEQWSGIIYCNQKTVWKQTREIQQTLSQGLHRITSLNQSIKLQSSLNICQGVLIKRLRMLTSVHSYCLISSHQGHSHILSLRLLSTPSRNDGNILWQNSAEI